MERRSRRRKRDWPVIVIERPSIIVFGCLFLFAMLLLIPISGKKFTGMWVLVFFPIMVILVCDLVWMTGGQDAQLRAAQDAGKRHGNNAAVNEQLLALNNALVHKTFWPTFFQVLVFLVYLEGGFPPWWCVLAPTQATFAVYFWLGIKNRQPYWTSVYQRGNLRTVALWLIKDELGLPIDGYTGAADGAFGEEGDADDSPSGPRPAAAQNDDVVLTTDPFHCLGCKRAVCSDSYCRQCYDHKEKKGAALGAAILADEFSVDLPPVPP